MSNNKLTFKRNDTRPYFKVKIIDESGNNVDLTGATVTFTMRNRSDATVKVNAASCTVTSATAGEVEYRWAATDLDTAGIYDGEFCITFSGPTILTLPSNNYIEIEVEADLS